MVEVSIEGATAVFNVQGWDKIWSLRSRLEIPLKHIKDVHADASPKMGWFQGLKVAGTSFPSVIRAGIFYQDHEWVFWDVHNVEKTIVIELHDEKFQKLVIEVEAPEEAIRFLQQALENARQAAG